MTIVHRSDEATAAFHNAADYAIAFPQYTLLSVDDFESGRRRLLQMANELQKITNPPSPPQPSLAAKAGP